MIPFDSFQTNITFDYIHYLVTDAALQSNMNMLRVWGGGIYLQSTPLQTFYSLCDELGILIWQEFIFACALYPTDTPFMKDIQKEVRFQIQRIQYHPSIAVWGGNNENEISLYGSSWYPEATTWNPQLYYSDYVELYLTTILPLVQRLDKARAFVDSSPSNGILSSTKNSLKRMKGKAQAGETTTGKPPEIDPVYAKRWNNPSSALYGDIHFYDYTMDCEDANSYPPTRFLSEFGFQSLPTFETLRKVLSEEDWLQSPVKGQLMNFRQRHPNGNEEMQNQLQKHFQIEELLSVFDLLNVDKTVKKKAFQLYLYLTQVQQARCYETAILRYRRGRGTFSLNPDWYPEVEKVSSLDQILNSKSIETQQEDINNSMLNMGILYWQLNDVWQGPTWASMEYGGKWKALQYMVKRSYTPLLLSFAKDKKGEQIIYSLYMTLDRDVLPQLNLSVDGDSSNSLQYNLIINLELISYGDGLLWETKIPVKFSNRNIDTSFIIWSMSLEEILQIPNLCNHTATMENGRRCVEPQEVFLHAFSSEVNTYIQSSPGKTKKNEEGIEKVKMLRLKDFYHDKLSRLTKQASSKFLVKPDKLKSVDRPFSYTNEYLSPVKNITGLSLKPNIKYSVDGISHFSEPEICLNEERSDIDKVICKSQTILTIDLTLTADKVALFVWLEINHLVLQKYIQKYINDKIDSDMLTLSSIPDKSTYECKYGYFSDNIFPLLPNTQKTIQYYCTLMPQSTETFIKDTESIDLLNITSLADTLLI